MYDPGNGITQFTFPHDTLVIATGHVSYDGIGTYAVMMSVVGNGAASTSRRSCLTRFSRHLPVRPPPIRATPTPGVRSVTDDLTDYSVTLGSPEQNIACADDGNGGCLCSYDIASEPSGGGLSGRWSTQGALLTHFADTKLDPVAGRRVCRRRHDDDLGPRPHRDLGSGRACARSRSRGCPRIERAPPSARARRRRGSR